MHVSRRAALKTMGTLGIAMPFVSRNAAGQTMNATAFALIGDGAHPFDMIRTVLDTNIVRETGITIDCTRDPSHLNPADLDGYRMLIFSRAYINGITTEQEQAVRTFVQNGGGVLFLHNSTDLARPTGTPILRDVIGGYWLQHSGNSSDSVTIRPYRVTIANREHPITRGVNDFVVTGAITTSTTRIPPISCSGTRPSMDGRTTTSPATRTMTSVWAHAASGRPARPAGRTITAPGGSVSWPRGIPLRKTCTRSSGNCTGTPPSGC